MFVYYLNDYLESSSREKKNKRKKPSEDVIPIVIFRVIRTLAKISMIKLRTVYRQDTKAMDAIKKIEDMVAEVKKCRGPIETKLVSACSVARRESLNKIRDNRLQVPFIF